MIKTVLLACLVAQSPGVDKAENLKWFLLENFGEVHSFSSEFHLDAVSYEKGGSGIVTRRGSVWIQYRYDGTNHYIEKRREDPKAHYDHEVIAWYDDQMSKLVHDKKGYHALTDGDEPQYFIGLSSMLSPRVVLKLSRIPNFPPMEALFDELRFVTAYEREYTVLSFYMESHDRHLDFYLEQEGALRRVEYCERPLPEGRARVNEPPRAQLEDVFPGDPFDLKIVGYRMDFEQWEDIGEGLQFPVQASFAQTFPVEWERDHALRHEIYESDDPDEALELSLERYLLETYVITEHRMSVATMQANPVLTKEDFMIDYPPGTVFAYWRASDVPLRKPPYAFENMTPTEIAIFAAIVLSLLSGAVLLWLFLSGRLKTPK